ncbi:Forkhead associated (FHA) domain, binds pSer, pThr, pTyr [Metschnikowia aff. pulcherrima]|uniref:RING-type E3 ubiquitin transferase n=1 Tax=Metschnikowia aff. pulcherrima TaxID=2163413 RepID=A0A4P6XTL5_9ASCO|nr:Forkhead associated (FHA) domain, binds pSer, pThr, pTyr [Metschnikowia aff. pulcherrima]
MTEQHSVVPATEAFGEASSATKTSVVSPISSTNNSFASSPPQGNTSNADSGADSEPLSDVQEETSSPALVPTASQGRQNLPPVEQDLASSQQNSIFPRQVGGDQMLSSVLPSSSQVRPSAALSASRRPSFGLGFLSSISNSIRGSNQSQAPSPSAESSLPHNFMSNSPTLSNLNNYSGAETNVENTLVGNLMSRPRNTATASLSIDPPLMTRENTTVEASDITCITENEPSSSAAEKEPEENGKDKDGTYSLRLTPIIDHSSSNTGLYFTPIIRRIQPKLPISIGRYTEKHRSAAHAPQGSSARIVFKSKVVSRTHALFQCNEEGLWFLKDCKSSSGTFLNNIRLSQASQELTLWPLMDGDVVQLGLDYRGGTEEVYRCVKMRCEFNRSWQRKVNRFNLDIHKKMKNLGVETLNENGEEFSECAICLLKLEPCQALFISPCSHSWHYKCIRPIIIKRYPQFYCPNCRSICDLETDIEDEDNDG